MKILDWDAMEQQLTHKMALSDGSGTNRPRLKRQLACSE